MFAQQVETAACIPTDFVTGLSHETQVDNKKARESREAVKSWRVSMAVL